MLFRKSRTQRATEMLKEALEYSGDVLRDEKLRADVRSAVGHGVTAADRVGHDSGLSEFVSQLEDDRKLRRNLRLLVADVESAGRRLRVKKRHRARKALLILGWTGVTIALVAGARRWITERLPRSGSPGTTSAAPSA